MSEADLTFTVSASGVGMLAYSEKDNPPICAALIVIVGIYIATAFIIPRLDAILAALKKEDGK